MKAKHSRIVELEGYPDFELSEEREAYWKAKFRELRMWLEQNFDSPHEGIHFANFFFMNLDRGIQQEVDKRVGKKLESALKKGKLELDDRAVKEVMGAMISEYMGSHMNPEVEKCWVGYSNELQRWLQERFQNRIEIVAFLDFLMWTQGKDLQKMISDDFRLM